MSGFPSAAEPLTGHDRLHFLSGVDALERYFQVQVSQDIRRRVTACSVAVEAATGAVAGFYTLSASDIPLTDISVELVKKLPRYPAVLAARVGRLAVDQRFRGQKLGSALLFNAIARAARPGAACSAPSSTADRRHSRHEPVARKIRLSVPNVSPPTHTENCWSQRQPLRERGFLRYVV